MACGLLDVLTLTRGRRLRALLQGPAQRYPHLVHVGAGWAFARLHLRPWLGINTRTPLLRWLAWDGFGFHQGFFHSDRHIGGQRTQRLMTPDQRLIVDQGLGRMLWFHECADVDGVALRIKEFPVRRRADLWSGIGLAATYAGGATPDELERLARNAADYRPHLAQGSAFASAAHHISGIVPDHTRVAAPILTGVEADEAAAWTDTALAVLGANPHRVQHYQRWRAEIRKQWRGA